MSYIAVISDVTHPDGMPLWESTEQPTAEAAYELAEQHIHATQPDDQIVPADDRGVYAVWAQNDRAESTPVATLTITSTEAPPLAPHQTAGPHGPHDPRVVGGRYRNHYWDCEYEVRAISFTAHGVLEFITVRRPRDPHPRNQLGRTRRDLVRPTLRTARRRRPWRRPSATTMTAQRFRVGQLVSAADPASLADLSPAYTVRSRHAIVVAADEHQAAVKWIDYRGLQHDPCVLPPALPRPGTLNAAARPA